MEHSREEVIKSVHDAQKKIESIVVKTPLIHSSWLSKECECNVYMKMESEQITNSFKLRGAANKITGLIHEDPKKYKSDGFVTASSGNHALACAHVLGKFEVPLAIFLPETVAPSKEKTLSLLPNVTLFKCGAECSEAESNARKHAQQHNIVYIPPYNDFDIMHGQATIGAEILSQLKQVDVVFVPVGGGGLIGGIALYVKSVNPQVHVVGVSPRNDCCMYESVCAGHIVEQSNATHTLAGGVAGLVEPGSVTFPVCQKYVDEWVLPDEEEIERAVYDVLERQKKMIEGAAALCVAALRKTKEKYKGKKVALVICGGNIGVEVLRYVLGKFPK